jgi:superfamily II DNA helicase RecQ
MGYADLHSICGQVLFVSPERFLSEEFLLIFRDALPVSLVAIDEAHCISEW